MDEKDAIDRLGPPDDIVGREDRMRRRAWVCLECRQVVASFTPITAPAPCARCGAIAFKTDPVRAAAMISQHGQA